MKESEQIKALLNSQEGEISNLAQLFIELSAATQKVVELEAELALEREKCDWLAARCEVFDSWPPCMYRDKETWLDLAEEAARKELGEIQE